MPTITSTSTQQVLDEIGTLKSTIDSFGEPARTKLQDIKETEDKVLATLPVTSPGQIDDAAWSQKDEKEQNTAYNRLLQVRDSLRSAAGLDGPTDEEHLMYGCYVSSSVTIVWLILSFVIVGILLTTIVWHWDNATSSDFTHKIQKADEALKELAEARKKEVSLKTALKAEEAGKLPSFVLASSVTSQSAIEQQKNPLPKPHEFEKLNTENEKLRAEIEIAQRKATEQAIAAVETIGKGGASEQTVLSMVMLLGALGGSLHLVTSLVMYIGNGQLKRRWLPYYLSLPVAGAALAPIVYMLLRVGMLTPTGTTNGTSGTSNLNLVGIYAFAALTGMFAKTATDKLSEVFSTLFRTGERPGRDKITAETSPP